MRAKLLFIVSVLTGIAGFCFFCSVAHAVFPENTWDVHISGATVVGIGMVDFAADGTVSGYIVIRPKAPKNITLKNPPDVINFGFFSVLGSWDYEHPGRVTGFISGGTQEVPLDISFIGTGNANTITMRSTSNDGPMTFVGKPAFQIDDAEIIGDWTAQVVKDKIRFSELFTLTPFVVCLDDPAPADPNDCQNFSLPFLNLYSLTGAGAGYELRGLVLLSRGKRIAIQITELEINKDTGDVATEGNIRAATGVLTANRTRSEMFAGDEVHKSVGMTIKKVPD